MGQRVLITGGSGFIGSALVNRLRAEPSIDEIVVFDGRERHPASAHGTGVTVLTGSILDRAELAAACRGIDVVVHLAARVSAVHAEQDPLGTHAINVTGTLLLLDVIAEQPRPPLLVFASSAAVYGAESPADPAATGHDPGRRPQGVYGASKAAAEDYIAAYQASRGISALVLRLYNVFGPGQSVRHDLRPIVPMAVTAALSGEPLTVIGDGEQIRDFTFVGDVAEVLSTAVIDRVSAPRPLDISWGACRSINDLIRVIEAESGSVIARITRPNRPEDIRVSRGNSADLDRWFPAISPTNFSSAIAATIAWTSSDAQRVASQ